MHQFDRPIIILSAPRSGSTLLFEVLSKSQSIWTIGGESHALIETIPKLNIAYRQFSSNALTEQDIDDELRQQLQLRFSDALQDNHGNKPDSIDTTNIRFLEKTPKNSLRVDFFNSLFPDALFIYLVREPKENISSIMQAWRSNKFVTYPNLPGWDKRNWSLLLPEKWQQLNRQPLQSIAAFQWQAANEAIMDSLRKIDSNRWCMVSYDQLIADPAKTVKQLCQFTDTDFDPALAQLCSKPLAHSRYTISTPKPNKWLENYHDIAKIWSSTAATLNKINHLLSERGHPIYDTQWQQHDIAEPIALTPEPTEKLATPSEQNVSRNSPCPCGSGKRFKQCHGQLR
ncbi:sulfotransferase [Shewanella frigidimarina]|uniref:sulfotransferase family protein n=1 Tax=Shewanella frigidimarina TaxID=56812 RepID=UPI003D7B3AF1